MTTVNIKIVGSQGDSVLVKYASENSAKSIDEYDAIAYQPTSMGYTTADDFLNGIREPLTAACIYRDRLENADTSNINLDDWAGASIQSTVLQHASDTQAGLNTDDSNAEVEV